MKKTLLYIIFIVCIQTINAQIQSSCEVPQVLQTFYEKDVKHLALKRITEQQSPFKDSIVIPQSYQDTIWEGLSAIFNLTTVPDRDLVFDNYCIHQYVSKIYHTIYVKVDTSYSWTHQWKNLNITTGISALDSLLANYGFTINSYWSSYNIAILYTAQNININPLCDSIEYFSGVIYSEPSGIYGDGDEIIYTKAGTEKFYDFVIGFGDCPAGCTSTRTFKFKVSDDCSVDYLGIFDNISYGDIFPMPTNCNITTNIENNSNVRNFNIYPNPSKDFINIESNYSSYTNYSITNLYGQILKTGDLKKELKILVKDFTSGIYLIQFYNQSNNEFVNLKFIKN
ncbi:MAG: hypothetical protein A2046_03340 [Bacteroidetes bacterium GWA2_30_7]|nr:MAG: hypothetical protein A2046_03340 [Bacteroidetes bacterium GWA2_30_7]